MRSHKDRWRALDFQRDVLKWIPWGPGEPGQPSQLSMHEAIWESARVVVRSANSIGKDAQVVRDALTWVYVHHGLVLITGPTQRQVREILFRKEIAKAFHRADQCDAESTTCFFRLSLGLF